VCNIGARRIDRTCILVMALTLRTSVTTSHVACLMCCCVDISLANCWLHNLIPLRRVCGTSVGFTVSHHCVLCTYIVCDFRACAQDPVDDKNTLSCVLCNKITMACVIQLSVNCCAFNKYCQLNNYAVEAAKETKFGTKLASGMMMLPELRIHA